MRLNWKCEYIFGKSYVQTHVSNMYHIKIISISIVVFNDIWFKHVAIQLELFTFLIFQQLQLLISSTPPLAPSGIFLIYVWGMSGIYLVWFWEIVVIILWSFCDHLASLWHNIGITLSSLQGHFVNKLNPLPFDIILWCSFNTLCL